MIHLYICERSINRLIVIRYTTKHDFGEEKSYKDLLGAIQFQKSLIQTNSRFFKASSTCLAGLLPRYLQCLNGPNKSNNQILAMAEIKQTMFNFDFLFRTYLDFVSRTCSPHTSFIAGIQHSLSLLTSVRTPVFPKTCVGNLYSLFSSLFLLSACHFLQY